MNNVAIAWLFSLCIIGGIGMGYWQGSFGAGVFGAIFLLAVWRRA